MFTVFHLLLVFLFLFIWAGAKNWHMKKSGTMLFIIFIMIAYLLWFPNVLKVYGDEPMLLFRSGYYNGDAEYNMAALAVYHVVYEVFGMDVINAIYANILFSALVLFMAGISAIAISKRSASAYFVIAAISIYPPFASAATSAYTAIFAVFFLITSILSFNLFLRNDSATNGLLALVSVMLSALCRFEYAAALPVLFLFWFIDKRGRPLSYWLPRITIALVSIALFAWYWLYPIVSEKASLWQSDSAYTFGFHNIFSHDIWVYGIPVLILISGFFILKSKNRDAAVFLGVSAGMFLFYSMNYYFATWFYVPIAALFFIASSVMISIERIELIIMLTIILMPLSAIFVDKEYTPAHAYAATALPSIIDDLVPDSCSLVTAYPPNINMGSDIRTYDIDAFSRDGCTYFLYDYLCQKGLDHTDMSELCSSFMNAHSLEKVYQMESAGFDFILYKVN